MLRAAATQKPERAAEIRAERIALLYRHAPLAILGSLVVPVLMVGVVWDGVARWQAAAWLVAMYAVGAARARLVIAYRRAAPPPGEADRWGRRFVLGAVVSGCTWGVGGVVCFVPASLASQFIVAFLLAGMCTGAVMSLGASLPAFYGFSLATMLPYAAISLAEADRVHLTVAVAILVWLAATTFFARNLHRTLVESLLLRFENLDLVAELTVQKEEAERANAAKTRFLAAASHDLRQPLHALTLFVSALQERLGAHEARAIVDRMAVSVEALDDLFNALLDISKLDAGIVRPDVHAFALSPLLARLGREYAGDAEAKGLTLRVVPTRLAVLSDPTLLERILRNLLANAVRYTDGGRVVLGCRRRSGTVRIEVLDTGRGIPPDQVRNVFQEFFQLGNPERDRAKGLGLGLAIVDRLARLLGHEVTVASRPGRGSRFTVSLPRVDGPVTAEGSRAAVEPGQDPLEGAVVLVVDDERAVREAVAEVLLGWGCRPVVAGSADEALATLSTTGTTPRAILADYRLREGQTGVEVIERVRAACGASIPAALVTGDTAPDRLRDAEASGYWLLHKPVQPARLRALLAHLLTG